MATAKNTMSKQDIKEKEVVFPNDFVFSEANGFQMSKDWKTVEEGKKYYANILRKIKEVKPNGKNAETV